MKSLINWGRRDFVVSKENSWLKERDSSNNRLHQIWVDLKS